LFVLFLSLMLAVPAWAEPAYVTDRFEITLRTGPGTQHKILKMLPSGTRLQVLERNDEGYVRVRSEDGVEGWVLARYLQEEPVARERLAQAQARLDRLRKEVAALRRENGDLKKENARLQRALEKAEAAQAAAEAALCARRTPPSRTCASGIGSSRGLWCSRWVSSPACSCRGWRCVGAAPGAISERRPLQAVSSSASRRRAARSSSFSARCGSPRPSLTARSRAFAASHISGTWQ